MNRRHFLAIAAVTPALPLMPLKSKTPPITTNAYLSASLLDIARIAETIPGFQLDAHQYLVNEGMLRWKVV